MIQATPHLDQLSMPPVALIVAYDEGRGIGYRNELPWGRSLKADLARFRELTTGHAVVMGRNTFDSIGRALRGRQNLVVTSRPLEAANVTAVPSLAEASALVVPGTTLFVIGGARLYREALSVADRLYITIVCHRFQTDVSFPAVDFTDWQIVAGQAAPANADNAYDSIFWTYYRALSRDTSVSRR